MGFQIGDAGDPVTFTVTGGADVRVVAPLREALLDALAGGKGVVLDLSGASSADVAFYQLTVAARRSFAAREVPFVIEGATLLAAAVPGVTSAPDPGDAR